MTFRVSGVLGIAAFVATCLLGSAQSLAQNAYITNFGSNNVSVINTAIDAVIATVPVGAGPGGVGVSPDGSKVYVANSGGNTVSVINTATNTVTATIGVGTGPDGVAVTPDGSKVYVTNEGLGSGNTVSVIDTATNTVIDTIVVGTDPFGVAVSPDGSKAYVANERGNTVSVIATATNSVTATILAGPGPGYVAVTPDGSKVYVTNGGFDGGVSVIDTATNTVIDTIPAGHVGLSIQTGVAVTPDGSKVYVANANGAGSVSVIDTATNMVIGSPIFVGSEPVGVAVTPDGSKVYVTNFNGNINIPGVFGSVSVIATATNTVTATIPVGTRAAAFGIFIQPLSPLPPSEVATTASGLAFSRVSRTFNGTVTITNISGGPISGPFQILFTGLTAGVTLANATGNFSGSPYLTIAAASLASGHSATVSAQFADPSFAPINFTPVIYSGNI